MSQPAPFVELHNACDALLSGGPADGDVVPLPGVIFHTFDMLLPTGSHSYEIDVPLLSCTGFETEVGYHWKGPQARRSGLDDVARG